MFELWQTRSAQQAHGVAETSEVDLPRVTGVTQINRYYQSVLGASSTSVSHEPSNAVRVAAELNAYLGASDDESTRFPTSRSSVGRLATGEGADDAEPTVTGLLAPTSELRAVVAQGDWAALAAWKIGPQAHDDLHGTARELIADRTVHGDLARYAAAFQAAGGRPSGAVPPRLLQRAAAASVERADYGHAADPRAAAGERADDLPARQVADLIGGFTALPEA